MSSTTVRPLADVVEAAAFLRRSKNGVYILCRENKLPYYRVGHSLRFDLDELKAWLEANRGGPQVGWFRVNPGKRKAPEGTGADAMTRHHQPESYTAGRSPFDIPAHPLHPAEAHFRLFVNTRRRARSHWWIAMIRRHQAECSWCRRCDREMAA